MKHSRERLRDPLAMKIGIAFFVRKIADLRRMLQITLEFKVMDVEPLCALA
jgi:hypothetical protein